MPNKKDNLKEELISLEGSVESIIYQNNETGYTVCEVYTNTNEIYTLVGDMPYLNEGETISALGNYITHPQFGKQFKVEFYEKELPATETAIQKYLSSGFVKGIGKVTAKRIVKKFGESTFDVIENNPEWLSDIPGITYDKAIKIGQAFKTQFEMRNIMMFCRNYFGPTLAVKIYKKFGQGTVEKIKRNPYILCEEVEGIGFEKSDKIAKDNGIDIGSIDRIKAGIKFILMHNAYGNGHTYLPREKLIEVAKKLLDIEEVKIDDAIDLMSELHILTTFRRDGENCVYLQEMYDAERYIVKKLDLLDSVNHVMSAENFTSMLQTVEIQNSIKYEDLQRTSIFEACNHGVFILTGGPGTGKTTVVRAIIRMFDSFGLKIALAAPTGRAAKRMSLSAGREAKTIHRLLEVQRGADNEHIFGRNEKMLLDEDAFIIDESSMMDLTLMDALLHAIKPGARVIFIGDSNQLPPVGPGTVYDDIIQSERYSMVKLTHIFRQAKESLIITNAHAINNGEHIVTNNKENDFFVMERNTPLETANTIVDLCKNRLPKKYGKSIFDGIQVIAPSKNGEAGTISLNSALQEALNPHTPLKKERKVRDSVFRIGDKVMQIKNNYDVIWITKTGQDGFGMFNGDIGFIYDIDTENDLVKVDFEGKLVEYDSSMLDELELAYAITVHKSQGSEYPIIVMPLYNYTPKLLTRNLLYTAVTRAQNLVVMVGDPTVANKMIANNKQTKRYCGLIRELKKY